MFSEFQVNCIVEHQVQFLGFTLILMDVRNHFNCTEQTKVYFTLILMDVRNHFNCTEQTKVYTAQLLLLLHLIVEYV